jgi:hypothetical protein
MATLPSSSRAAPEVARAPSTRASARNSEALSRMLASGALSITSVFTRHPPCRRTRAAASSLRLDCCNRRLFMRTISLRTASRACRGMREVGGSAIGSTAFTRMATPPVGAVSPVSKRTARREVGLPSNPMTKRRMWVGAARTTSTGHDAAATTCLDTLPASSLLNVPWPRQPITIASAPIRLASLSIAAGAGSWSSTTLASGQCSSSFRRRTSASACNARTLAAVKTREPLAHDEAPRATTPVARLGRGHGNAADTASAAFADGEPSLPISIRNCLATFSSHRA